jgi:hypothetical protein
VSDEEAKNKDEAEMEETVVEESDDADEDFHPFDEVREDYKPSEIKKVIAEDGLPTNHAPVQNNDIPPLSPDTLVCMGDYSQFVQRDKWGEITRTLTPSEVKRAPNGEYYVLNTQTKIRNKVEPIRPPCKHYVRQMVSFEFNADHDSIKRLCSARRTTEGAFMTVKDTKVSACDMREPRHVDSEKLLDEFDEKKVKQGQDRTFSSIFNTEVEIK